MTAVRTVALEIQALERLRQLFSRGHLGQGRSRSGLLGAVITAVFRIILEGRKDRPDFQHLTPLQVQPPCR